VGFIEERGKAKKKSIGGYVSVRGGKIIPK